METIKKPLVALNTLLRCVSTLPIRNGNYLPVSNLDKNAEDMFNALAISFVSTLPIRNGNL